MTWTFIKGSCAYAITASFSCKIVLGQANEIMASYLIIIHDKLSIHVQRSIGTRGLILGSEYVFALRI